MFGLQCGMVELHLQSARVKPIPAGCFGSKMPPACGKGTIPEPCDHPKLLSVNNPLRTVRSLLIIPIQRRSVPETRIFEVKVFDRENSGVLSPESSATRYIATPEYLCRFYTAMCASTYNFRTETDFLIIAIDTDAVPTRAIPTENPTTRTAA